MPVESPGRVLVVGDVITDVICKPEGPLVVGSDRRATIRSRPGGSGANQAVWLAAFGLEVRFAARVGVADLGTFGSQFSKLGVEPALVGDPDLPSGMIVTIVDPDGERSFLTDRGANVALCEADLPPSLLDGCQVLVVSGYSLFEPRPRRAVMGLIAAAVVRHVPVAVDPASVGFLEEVGPGNFLAWTRGATTIFANDSEALALTGGVSLAARMVALGATYPRVVIKCGALGAAMGNAAGIALSLPAPAVDVLDTTGAGDAFAAAFIAAELGGGSPEDCLSRAIAAGADAVLHLGGQPQAIATER
ncbi:MAG: PfkB family carbohydrate kinase [Devosia sp.]|nr:PfkB family carbohydrate kinase [Devosia sp.]